MSCPWLPGSQIGTSRRYTRVPNTMSSHAALARLVNLGRLRAIYLAGRHDTGQFPPPTEPDPDLINIVDEPYESLNRARSQLDRLKGLLRRRNDRRAIFLTIYTAMTRAVQHNIERGQFADPEWMRRYTLRFANYYRDAFFAFEQGRTGSVPKPWRAAFGTAIAGDGLVVQDAFLGINAHVNYDLALTIRDVGIDPNRGVKRDDHRVINNILARLVDAQQKALAELYAAGIDDVDMALGRFDEAISLFTLEEARAQAWRVGVVLVDLDSRLITAYARWVLRTTAEGGAVFILAPTLPSDVMRVLNRVEQGQFDLEHAVDLLDRRLKAVDVER